MAVVVIMLTLTLMFALICHILAEKRGRPRGMWAVLGALFGPFAAIALLIMGRQTTDDNDPTENG